MKRSIMATLAILLAITVLVRGQEPSGSEEKELQKQLKKEQQAEEAAQKAEVVRAMVEYGRFVLEADRLRDKRGNTVNVPSTLNFIALDSIHGVIQIGSNGYVGMNGVGGITVEGPISNYEYTQNQKNKVYNVSYVVRSVTGTYDVRMIVYPEGRADATISSSWPGQVNYNGYLVPPGLSRVYKGMSY
jgi:hypothetical protein